MKIKTVGIDLAKHVFQIHGVDEHGKTVLARQLRHDQMATFFANLPPCLIGIEACGGGAPLGTQAAGLWSHGQADGIAVRQTLCQDQ